MDFEKSPMNNPKPQEEKMDLGLEQQEQQLEQRHENWVQEWNLSLTKDVKNHPYLTQAILTGMEFLGGAGVVAGINGAIDASNPYATAAGLVAVGSSAALTVSAYIFGIGQRKMIETASKIEKEIEKEKGE